MSFTVNDPGPEREPEPTYDTSVVHYDLDNVDLLTGCGLELHDLRGHDTYSTDPAAVDCSLCAATLVDGQLAEAAPALTGYEQWVADRDKAGQMTPAEADAYYTALERQRGAGPVSVTITAETAAFVGALDVATAAVDGLLDQIGPPPERRTVGLEVLTDELRAEYEKASDDPVWGGSVAVVCRVNGKAIDVPELDTLWAAPYRKPADILSILLRQARMYADGLDGNAGAELLMPGAAVLGALSGNIWAGFTASVESRWGIVQPGWWVSVETLDRGADPDVEWALVDDLVECHDPVCVVRRGQPSWACAVTTVQGRGVQHLDAFRAVYVRIPADSAVQA